MSSKYLSRIERGKEKVEIAAKINEPPRSKQLVRQLAAQRDIFLSKLKN